MIFIVIIPCYNEEKSIYELVKKAKTYADVCVIDDASTDRTPEIIQKIGEFKIITHKTNTHIPGAIRDGMKYAIEKSYDYAITMDAGFSHDPKAIPSFLEQTKYDCVIGVRKKKVDVPLYRKFLSWLGARVVNYGVSSSWLDFKGPNISDCTSGFRMYSKKAMKEIISTKIYSKSFDFHMEALSILCFKGYTLKQIPIKYTHSNSSFNFRVLLQAVRFGFLLISRKVGNRM